ncbi:nitroreductase family deazaflavin-dependent oxidoreductase [Thermobifida cellulosilytica]|uniref:Cell entry protein n=1 Tax=Thermobifida cellulosilytica TB100 TaxID=665004 RepID=A0A147KFA0_THECS|nr:nitroreductase family deazaflavin-dependent oxidoreductase [Thermobifida cellulosilytica]KUP95940.1 cell entry protein [Thermobifida cellulosilytica TB100]
MNDFNRKIIEEFRANGGTVTSAPFGRTLVLVHHRGAKSGIERVNPLVHVRQDPDTWLVAASKGGAPDNPAWYHNLLAHPETTIETPDDGVVDVRVEELTGEERDAAWERFKAERPGFREYEKKTARTIPVLALRRRT